MNEDLLRFKKDKLLTFVDFETQNLCLNECHNLPWEVAILETNGREISDSYEALIKWNPPLKISKQAALITRYDPKKVELKGKDPKEVAQRTYDSFQRADYIIGHNVFGFDYYVANSLFRTVGLGNYNFISKLVDTNILVKGLKLGIPYKHGENLTLYQYRLFHKHQGKTKTSLGAVAKEYGIEVDEARRHAALYDLEINFEFWKKIIFQIDL